MIGGTRVFLVWNRIIFQEFSWPSLCVPDTIVPCLSNAKLPRYFLSFFSTSSFSDCFRRRRIAAVVELVNFRVPRADALSGVVGGCSNKRFPVTLCALTELGMFELFCES